MTLYLFLKTIHIIAIFLFLTASAITFFAEKATGFKIVVGVSAMIILIAGLGMTVQLETVPVWVMVKFGIWFVWPRRRRRRFRPN